ncbi:MAG: pilus assembly protein PilM [Minisyncoccia bacterium]
MSVLENRLRVIFPPPAYLARRAAGVDVSTSGVKITLIAPSGRGLMLARYADVRLPAGCVEAGEIVDRAPVVALLTKAARELGFSRANVSLPESKAYLFETTATGSSKEDWRTAIEPRLDEFIPLTPAEAAFDIAAVGKQGTETLLAGVGYARRVIEGLLAVFDEAGIETNVLEGENFALARALLPWGDASTVLIIDIGKTTTKLAIVGRGIPRFATTIGIGGHALTLAVQKHFGVTEEEAKVVKAERGIVPSPGNEEYLAAMLSTCSAIRDEIARRLAYWQGHAATSPGHERVTKALLVGGNASVRGLAEYLEGALRIPVGIGDVFTNFAPRDYWLPPFDYDASLAYGTALGLALRDWEP